VEADSFEPKTISHDHGASHPGPMSTVNAGLRLDAKLNWRQQLVDLIDTVPSRQTIVIVGIGHPLKSDDYVGSLITKDLMGQGDAGRVIIMDAEHSPENLLGQIPEKRPGLLILIDSLELGLKPGTIAVLDLDQVSDSFFTTHNIPLRLVLGSLCNAPKSILLGVQPGKLDVGGRLSREVSNARRLVVDEIKRIIERLKGDSHGH
jgi:hydrogenase 3 maturation protease